MSRYIVRRLLLAVVTLWALATLGFLLVEAIPGDPARQLAGPTASVQTVQAIRHAYGFDRPAWDRYVSTLVRFTHFDLGYAFSRSEPVRSVIARDVGHTLTLTVLAFLGELLIGIPLAVFVTSRKGRLADGSLVAAAGATSAVPTFLVGLLLLYAFSFRLRWFPLGGTTEGWRSYVLPVLTVAVPYGLVLGRILRTSMLDELERPYVQFALARGERMGRIRWRDVLPNSLVPLFSVLALDFAGLFATVAVVEVVFSIPGVGEDLFGAIRRLDTSLIIGIALVAGLVVVTVNLLADLAVIAIDPRVRRATLG
ncbi:MAG: ABC transporter permease [Actinobacteria bacterium]|nr:ABC transporter permease [Actinomycetota bacterium]